MAFDTLAKRKSLVLIASVPTETGSRVVNFYGHATTVAAATALAANYFDGCQLKVNDVILIMSVADGTGDLLIVKVTAVTDTSLFTGISVDVNSEASGS